MDKPGIFETNDGSHSILSEKFGVTYHSKHGAIQETNHVYLKHGLFEKLDHQNDISILEIGFGTGLNALMTLISLQDKPNSVDYHTFEAFPIDLETVKQLNYPELLNFDKDIFLSMHESQSADTIAIVNQFQFTKYQQDFFDIDFKDKFDIIYYDAYGPGEQPELWDAKILEIMYDALKANGILVTYCAQGAFKRALKAVGFRVEALDGPHGKREMTRGVK